MWQATRKAAELIKSPIVTMRIHIVLINHADTHTNTHKNKNK